MKQFITFITIVLFSANVINAQSPCKDGLCVVQFNAGFNEKNKVTWLSELTDCTIKDIDIMTDASAAGKYKIVVVPTIVIYNDGEEVKRFQANIMMTMEATVKDVQHAIDDVIMEGF